MLILSQHPRNERLTMYRPELDTEDHRHAYSDPYHARLSGSYVRECEDCGVVLAYWDDDDAE